MWTYNLACLRCLFQTAAAWFPCIITTGRCVRRVVRSWDPTALRRASKPQKPAAARVRVGLCGHSWATQNWHIKQKVMGLSRGHTIQHLIPMKFQLLTKLYLWGGGHRSSAAATWAADRTFFFYSGTGSSENCARATQVNQWGRPWLVVLEKMKFGGFQWSISCFLRTNCQNRIFIVAIKTVFARFRIFIATIKLRPKLIFLWWR